MTSHRMVVELLHEMSYSLQANPKTIEGCEHPDRNAQFEHISVKLKSISRIISLPYQWIRRKKSWWGISGIAVGNSGPKGNPRFDY